MQVCSWHPYKCQYIQYWLPWAIPTRAKSTATPCILRYTIARTGRVERRVLLPGRQTRKSGYAITLETARQACRSLATDGGLNTCSDRRGAGVGAVFLGQGAYGVGAGEMLADYRRCVYSSYV